jgi:putative DNA primase/helicase
MSDLRALARALGGEISGRQVLAPGPGHGRLDRSLSIRFDPAAPGGFVVHSFAGNDPIACKDYVRERLGLPAWEPGDEQDRRIDPLRRARFDRMAMDREATKRPRSEDDHVRIKRAVAIWKKGGDPRGTLAETYLRSRALDLTDELAGDVLRFHPQCPWRNEDTGTVDCIPALVAAFRSIDDGTVTAVQRIALDTAGAKVGRRMLGVVHRAAIMLDPIGPELAVGEGFETCMAARQLGIRPTWALGSTGGISGFPVLDGVNRLTVLGEIGEASADAVQFVGRRWHKAGRRLNVIDRRGVLRWTTLNICERRTTSSTATPAGWAARASCRSAWVRRMSAAARGTGSSSRTRWRRR